jgi:hypothetical protein
MSAGKMGLPASVAISEEDIKQIIDEYLRQAPLIFQKFGIGGAAFPAESVSRNLMGQENLLVISKCRLIDLSVKVLRRLPIYLLREFAVQVEFDSVWFWALTHDVMRRLLMIRRWELEKSFNVLMAANFANLSSMSVAGSRAGHRLNTATSDIVSEPVRDLVGNARTVVMYLCYPVLEGLTKQILSSLVKQNGEPVASFSVGKIPYKVGGKKISSLAILLQCIEENGAILLSKPELSANLRDVRLEVEKMPQFRNKNGWESIYNLRNALLHGAEGEQLRSGLMTNLICLLLWNCFDEKDLQKEVEMLRQKPVFYFEGYYYPPEF